MEARFTNRCRLDEPTLRETYAALLCRPTRIVAMALAAFFIVQMLLLALLLPRGGEMLAEYWWALALWGAGLAWMIAQPRLLARRTHRRHRTHRGDAVPEVTAAFHDDEIVLHEGRNEAHYPYTYVVRVRRTRRLWLLRLDGREAIVLDRTGFAGIDDEGFGRFLRAKCPQAKWKI